MKIVLLMIILLSTIAIAEECYTPIDPADIPCQMITTYSFNCSANYVLIYNQTPALIGNATWDYYGVTDRCNISWNYTKAGTYILNSTDGSSMHITVDIDNAEYGLYLIGVGIFILLLIIGFITEYEIFPILAGMLCTTIGVFLITNGFPNLANDFLKYTVSIVVLGLGFYLMIAPSISYLSRQ